MRVDIKGILHTSNVHLYNAEKASFKVSVTKFIYQYNIDKKNHQLQDFISIYHALTCFCNKYVVNLCKYWRLCIGLVQINILC